ncbi:probable Xaa-Pro aminopeptidase 3 isoform X1 [Spodoptera litura]|uniref:Probable Xaa-Pro aminopeptidase 3 isoform X1 n=1 Tax=Spodoptera litura TaxID=69820 RepID=A0A9J7IRG1_SPOLT|nr:probable Xaa-Pro aminopeptidase 3 isoform X1 [Spodoptera litura]
MQQLRKLVGNTASKERRKLFRQSHFQDTIRCMSAQETPTIEKNKIPFVIPKGTFGQPTYHTHPHLIKEEHLTWGVTQAEYKKRRETLVAKLVAESENMHNTHIVVIPAARKQYMSDKIPYVFRQHSDFFYLTGCLEPSAILVLMKPAQTDEFKSILFVHEKDAHAELWEGPRTGCTAAARLFCMDECRPVENFNTYLNKLTTNSKPAVLWYHNEEPANPDIHNAVRGTLRGDINVTLSDPKRALHFMRVIKSPAEIELMKETCYIGSQSINMAMACTKPGISEHMVNAVLEYSCKQGGAEHLAFPPVVAGGARATHIHYVANNQLLNANEMILVDSGSQHWMYNSDISRTWPVAGKFSKHHRILYELVLTVQKRLIELVGEQRPALDKLFDSMCRLLGKHLKEEGIISKTLEGQELFARAYRLCPHHVSHYLGLDVHDAPLVRRNIPVCTNMVVTVEPGIYIRPDDTTVPKEFRGIGIRVEDDVLITDKEPVVLTEDCVKEVADIEAIVGKHTL